VNGNNLFIFYSELYCIIKTECCYHSTYNQTCYCTSIITKFLLNKQSNLLQSINT